MANEPILYNIETPVDSLWGAFSNVLPPPLVENTANRVDLLNNFVVSGLAILFFILFFYFYREVKSTVVGLFANLFKFKQQLENEEKLSWSNQRNITAFISVILLSLIFGYFYEDQLNLFIGLDNSLFIILFLGSALLFWLFKSMLYRFTGWIVRSPQTFSLVGKVGYNHIIIATVLTLPLVFEPLLELPSIDLIAAKYLIITYSILFMLYLERVRRVIIGAHFSHIFYILYLCSVEILPPLLLINLIVSYL